LLKFAEIKWVNLYRYDEASQVDEEAPKAALQLMEAVASTMEALCVADEIEAFAAEVGQRLRAVAKTWDEGAGTVAAKEVAEGAVAAAAVDATATELASAALTADNTGAAAAAATVGFEAETAAAREVGRVAQLKWLLRAAATLRPHVGGDLERDLVDLHPLLLAVGRCNSFYP
jgi:hypothetical protein